MSKITEDVKGMKRKCCICGKEFYGYGNNPEPIQSEGRCCDDCNEKYVIPARFHMIDLDTHISNS